MFSSARLSSRPACCCWPARRAAAITFAKPDTVYVIASLLSVTGVVLQDVVADAMSTEVVTARTPTARRGRRPRSTATSAWCRCSAGWPCRRHVLVAGLSGYLAQIYSYQTVFLIGLIVPLISVSGALLMKLETSRAAGDRLAHSRRRHRLRAAADRARLRRRAVQPGDRVRRVDGGRLRHAVARRRTDSDRRQRTIMYAAVIIFVYRAMPSLGEGYSWFTIDVLGFDEGF